MDSIDLSVFASRIESVCDEMGAVLRRVAFSPNIKDRLDYSCAIFDVDGELCAQAAHIPVHLGSMAYAAKDIVKNISWHPGDMLVLNDPFLGGTHLPDVTLIAPFYDQQQLLGFVANRAHHADIGACSPGSMPISTTLSEEGLVIPPTKLLENDQEITPVMQWLLSTLQNPQQSHGDFSAQVSANRRGLQRMSELLEQTGIAEYRAALVSLNDYASRLAQQAMADIAPGVYAFSDVMDDDGQGNRDIVINASIQVSDDGIQVDFTGTSEQVKGNINCPLSVAAAAVYYVFRCLLPDNAPACAGSFRHIQLSAPPGSLLNAQRPAAVTAGNVETSTRIVDVITGALSRALPEKMPAASHGSMNNLAMGSPATKAHEAWDYYETIGGGMGASTLYNGLDGVQTHMTNTLNTPIEVLEMNYPLRVTGYAFRTDSAGQGTHRGGQGIIRAYTLLQDTHVTVLSERRVHAPWGVNAGSGGVGVNIVNGQQYPGKFSAQLKAGDSLTIKTPGGGGYTDSG
ncbi:MAG TPA: hydantoinase B/oxoprolinase family protein [Gammaproteobacteria bacterium]|nr:hydantoinase B/oxoprolinase family protein [Gammaproteobacteria bacterium]